MSDYAPSMSDERVAWNKWNVVRGQAIERNPISREQADVIVEWLRELRGRRLRILEVGCGSGWMTERLAEFGEVTGIDLADEVLAEARLRSTDVRYIAGDFLTFDFGDEDFDVIVGMETMAHFEDQEAFLARISDLLVPGGLVMIAAQNRPIMERNLKYIPASGWYRRWVDHDELRAMVENDFVLRDLRSITPKFFSGPLHLLNSEKLEQLTGRIGLRPVLRRIKRWEEQRWMGWTLMCRAQKPLAVRSNGEIERVSGSACHQSHVEG